MGQLSDQESIRLMVGLGNPGERYLNTRHNAGVWFLQSVARFSESTFKEEKKFFGQVAMARFSDSEVMLLLPQTYMNESGRSVAAIANYYKMNPSQILVAHDEVDLPVGRLRLKEDGGLAGHNGLRDISRRLGSSIGFKRLRIGVGRPKLEDDLVEHVLGKPPLSERKLIEDAILLTHSLLSELVTGSWQKALSKLHTEC
ncbi:MAG: aminoacyl-tRNA hydrolase [Pseudomonadota bacterium]|nr:aminoacyl-tRNA hydrolase [Pseudomonadota bacterium]